MITRHYTVESGYAPDRTKIFWAHCRYCPHITRRHVAILDATAAARAHLSSAHADKLPPDRLDQL